MRPRPKGPEAKARDYEAEADDKILASRPVWPRSFNISALYSRSDVVGVTSKYSANSAASNC